MSEPLNDFLEGLDRYATLPDVNDADFGGFVRRTFAEMNGREATTTATTRTVTNQYGDPVQVTVPQEG